MKILELISVAAVVSGLFALATVGAIVLITFVRDLMKG